MNKKFVSIIIFVSLFCSTGFALADSVTLNNPLTGVNNFTDLLNNILKGVAGLVASLSIIMLIIAGILYLTSAGSPEKMGTAKKALIAAIIGIVIAVAASSIAALITAVLTGTI